MNNRTDSFKAITRGLIFVFLIGLGIFVYKSYLNDVKAAENYRENGSQTTATVITARNYTERETTRHGRQKHRSTTIVDYTDFTIEYTVDGEDYTKSYSHQKGTRNEGDTLTVYYLNSEPDGELRFYLDPPKTMNIVFSVAPVAIGLIGLIVTLVQYKHSKQY